MTPVLPEELKSPGAPRWPVTVTERTLLLGALAFLVALGVTLLLSPRSLYPEWFFPRMTGWGALAHAVLLVLPGILFHESKHRGLRAARERGSLVRLRLLLALSAVLGLGGSLGLYRLHDVGFDYDKALHLVSPLLMTFAISRFVYWRYDVTLRRALLTSIAIVGAAMIAWELTELASDFTLGTAAFGQGGHDLALDTALDMGLGLIGTAAGAWVTRHWRSEPPPPQPVTS